MNPGQFRLIVFFAIGLALGSPLAIQSWKISREFVPARIYTETFHAKMAEIVQKVLRD